MNDLESARSAYEDGLRHVGEGLTQEAGRCFEEAVRIFPTFAGAWCDLGVVRRRLGRTDDAIFAFRQAIQLDAGNAAAHFNLGNALKSKGDLFGAVASYTKSIEADPKSEKAYVNLSNLLIENNQLDRAEDVLLGAVEALPESPAVWLNMDVLRHNQGRDNEALEAVEKTIALAPDNDQAHSNRATTLARLGRFEDALDAHERALALAPNNPSHLIGLCNTLRAMGNYEKALETCEKIIELEPNNAEARVTKGLVLLLFGDFETGTKEYDWRWKTDEMRIPDLGASVWNGEPLQGKTILVYGEQGLGDTIQFARYIPKLAAQGATVILQCRPQLIRLLRSVEGTSAVGPWGAAVKDLDFHAPLLNLMRTLGTTMDTIPDDVPYVAPDETDLEGWYQRLGDKAELQVGVAWAGSPTHKGDKQRSIEIEVLKPLFDFPDVQFFSLQKHDRRNAGTVPDGVADLAVDLHDFADTAAAIACLDLVITVDTAVAHLAGALGKPVWVMLPFVPDWRWLLDRDNSPWYPTMKLYRQPNPGDWDSVIGEVRQDLENYCATPQK